MSLGGTGTLFGFKQEGWKPWTTFDGTPVLVPAGFNTEPEPNGDLLLYPEGDKCAPPSGRMPARGWYFDAIIRQPPIDEDNLNLEDNLEEFGPISDEELEHYRSEAERLYTETDKAILGRVSGTELWRHRAVPASHAQASQGHPRRGRVVHEHRRAGRTMSMQVFERQCEIASGQPGAVVPGCRETG